jgi:transcriptional regulator with XRE-family HTH domain
MTFQNKLRNLRISRGLTQMEVAEGLGTSQSSITSWESGRREPDFATIRRLADYFNVPMSSLLPSEDMKSDDELNAISQSIAQNPKLRLLFDRTKFLSDSDLDAIIAIVNALAKDHANE